MPRENDRGKAAHGICKLTHEEGVFVKSHIYPEAVTRHETKGAAIYEIGEGRRPRKLLTSWYDRELCTLPCEKILSVYDNWAIRCLRRHKLVWSGWGGDKLDLSDATLIAGGYYVRQVKGDDWLRLRLFYLSLLWRAAQSARDEFAQIVLPEDDLETLRLMVKDEVVAPLNFYPISLVQLTSRGPSHNLTPLAQDMAEFPPGSGTSPIFRFYFQGLIAHVFRPKAETPPDRAPFGVGTSDTLTLMARPYEGSWQEENLNVSLMEAYRDWPQIRPQISPALFPLGG